ncbi:MAG TPA: DUF433 domain-containing protein, partial [Acidobacteriota bacterium]|nr:DUF433 domain-containing protein [Acidobacteriota bacterium]
MITSDSAPRIGFCGETIPRREGASEADLLDAYARLTQEDIKAAIRYAADTLAHEDILISN